MIFLLIVSLLFCSVHSQQQSSYHVDNVTFVKNQPVHIPETAGKKVYFEKINGTLFSDSLSQLDITELELGLERMEKIEAGSVCSTPSLQKLSLYLGYNPITLTKEILQNCEKLQSLYVRGSPFQQKIHKVESDAFENLPNLKQMVISYIDIPHVTKQQFKNLINLEELTLENCFIEEIDSESFDSLQYLKDLQVTARSYEQKSTLLSHIQKTVENVTLAGLKGPLKPLQLNVTNLNLDFIELENVESGVIFGSSLKKLNLAFRQSPKITLHKDVLKDCENLEDLVITGDYNTPSSVDHETFQNLPKLKNVNLKHLEIGHVTKDTFKNSVSLETITLCDDSVEKLDTDAFASMKNLKDVTICFSHEYEKPTESLMKNTMKVDKLTYKNIDGKFYIPHLDVKELYLHFKYVRRTEPGSICGPPLKKFKLEYQGKIDFNKDVLNCGNLEELALIGSRKLQQFPLDVFENLQNLKSLYLERFNFSTIKRGFFEKLQNLETLTFDHCDVESFDESAFDDLTNLKVLQISSNRPLRHIPKNLFKNKKNLKKLLLFRNNIADLTWDEFEGLTSLETLNVRGNAITSFDSEKIARNMPNLKKIDIVLNDMGREQYYSFVEELKGKLPVEFAILPRPFL